MDKINLLQNVASDLRHLADSIQALLDVGDQGEPQAMETTEAKTEQPSVSLEQVRAVLADNESGVCSVRALAQILILWAHFPFALYPFDCYNGIQHFTLWPFSVFTY